MNFHVNPIEICYENLAKSMTVCMILLNQLMVWLLR